MWRLTAESGARPTRARIGRPTERAAGFGKTGMDGPGLAPIRGDGRRTTTAAGSIAGPTAGAGIRDRFMDGTTTARRWWHSSALAVLTSAWGFAARGLAGC